MPEIITEITEVTISASVTLENVQSTATEEDALVGLVQTLTAVLVEVISGDLGYDQELVDLTITAVNGQPVGTRKLRGGSGRSLQGVEDLSVDFVTIVEEIETCSSARGEGDKDSIGRSDEEVGAEGQSYPLFLVLDLQTTQRLTFLKFSPRCLSLSTRPWRTRPTTAS